MRATVVEIGQKTVGLAIEAGSGFSFCAAAPAFACLDGKVFRRLADLDRAVADVARSTKPGYAATALT